VEQRGSDSSWRIPVSSVRYSIPSPPSRASEGDRNPTMSPSHRNKKAVCRVSIFIAPPPMEPSAASSLGFDFMLLITVVWIAFYGFYRPRLFLNRVSLSSDAVATRHLSSFRSVYYSVQHRVPFAPCFQHSILESRTTT